MPVALDRKVLSLLFHDLNAQLVEDGTNDSGSKQLFG
jgi:hypothetical protein